jgi:hypothetical protein
LILEGGCKENKEQMITRKQPQVDKGDKINDTDLQEKAGGTNNTNETDVVLAVNISISQLSYFNYSSDSSSKVKSGGKIYLTSKSNRGKKLYPTDLASGNYQILLHLKVTRSSLVAAVSSSGNKDSMSGTDNQYSIKRDITIQKKQSSQLNQSVSKLSSGSTSPKPHSIRLQRTIHAGAQSLYHGVFTNFQHHNVLTKYHDQKALIISLMTICKLTITPAKACLNAEVSSWRKND